MFYLKIDAPFAAYRPFVAGNFRPTAPFITLSAAYGLLLNLAGVEMRSGQDGETTLIEKSGLPSFELALGAFALPAEEDEVQPQMPTVHTVYQPRNGMERNPIREPQMPTVHTVYQQLHNYPVGAAGKEHAEKTFGGKYNITPVSRSFLNGLRCLIACRNYPENLDKKIKDGLAGEGARYGLPFMGDNNYLPNKIDCISQPDSPVFWFSRIREGTGIKQNTGRLTVTIDRGDSANTRSALFAPIDKPSEQPPNDSWECVNYNRD